MKTLKLSLICLLLLFVCRNTYAQYIPSIEVLLINDVEGSDSNMLNLRNGDAYDFYNNLRTWIPYCNSEPLKNPPITYIEIAFHVFLDNNGEHNVYTNTQEGKDKLLTDYYNGIIENEELLQETINYHNEILAVTNYMEEISRSALFSRKSDSLIDLNQIRDWYDEIYTLNAKYSLAETYYQLGKFEEGFKTLALIPKKYNLNEDEMMRRLDDEVINDEENLTVLQSSGLPVSDNITLIPTPTTGELQILGSNKQLIMKNVEVFDGYGKKLLSHTADHTPHTVLDISHLASGLYFIKIKTENRRSS
ncbi:MAG: T9SS type A sorting domain-containing protein [Bacteroidetes bacterium]|nr:T9SS type A sorting domain-containing protein [Bacteroidota bacterium]MCL1968813.1 T9SS type A sorting domain-containing protein [Bacteroidota bacterium]